MSQFFYIHPENPQLRLLRQACDIIESGGVVIYPTDSGYAIGCQMGNKSAIQRISQIRQISDTHHFSIVCRDLNELSVYANVDNQAFRLLKNNTPGCYTFILRATKEVPKRLQNPKRKTIGLRIPDNRILLDLLAELGQPLITSSLLLPGDEMVESDPEMIRDRLERQVDLIIHGGYLPESPSTVIDLSEGTVDIVRAGVGDTAPFE